MPSARLLQLLVMLAVMFAPLSMMRAHAAMAMPAPAATAIAHHEMAQAPSGHCAEATPARQDERPGDQSRTKNIDCTIACSCMPPAAGQVAERAPFTARPHRPGPFPLLAGLSPQAEPRPPKRS